MDVSGGVSVTSAWEKHFATTMEKQADVRETVRQLWREKKYDEIVALIQAALRHNQVQSWMYEALSLALQASGRPKEEIERAVMSAIEFAETPLDMMFIGLYLERIGLKPRALQVYRSVSQIDPAAPEPYLEGLRVAQDLKDAEGVRWASVGILGQVWPNKLAHVWKKGYDAAAAALEELRAKNRKEERNDSRERWMRQSFVTAWSLPLGPGTLISTCSSKSPRERYALSGLQEQRLAGRCSPMRGTDNQGRRRQCSPSLRLSERFQRHLQRGRTPRLGKGGGQYGQG